MSNDFITSYTDRLAYRISEVDACEDEKIHKIGAIQSFGLFVSCDPRTLLINAISENSSRFLSGKAEDWLGQPLTRVVSLRNGHDLNAATIGDGLRNISPAVWIGNDRIPGIAFFHPTENNLTVDIEAEIKTENDRLSHYLHQLITGLETSTELENDCQLATQKIQSMIGFERVMVYRFHTNWDGEVVAETKTPDLDPFLYLRYPASDIPAQARQLYLTQNYRLIADTQDLPIPVICGDGQKTSDIDLSDSILRASSPIHLKYLHNMGIRGSFSLPLKVQNRLWGLISCHSYSAPALCSTEARTTCELAARILSGRIAHHIERRRLMAKRDTLEFTQSLFRNITEGQSTLDAFRESQDQLLRLTESEGAVVRIQGEDRLLGKTPPQNVIDACFEAAKELQTIGIWKTDSLEETLGIPTAGIAGALASPLSFGFEEGLIWFRPEEIQEVRWGGQPRNKSQVKTLEPRASFAAWTEKVGRKSRPWTEQNEDSAQYLLFNFMKGIFAKAAALASANRELERMTRAKDEFIGLVSHELRTPLSAIIGWVDILKDIIPQGEGEVSEAIEIIDRNAHLQVNLINDLLDISRIISGKLRLSMHSGIQLGALINDVIDSLKPMADARSVRIEWSDAFNPIVTADPNRMRQVVWNLLSNAIKFTAKAGKVSVDLKTLGSSYSITIKDNGIGLLPDDLGRVFDRFLQVDSGGRSKSGLGLGLSIVKALVELHGGTIRAESEGLGKGASFIVDLPLFSIKPQDQQSEAVESYRAPFRPVFLNMSILVVEDQKDSGSALRILIERMKGRCTLVADGHAALEEIKKNDFDLIISDIGMPGMDGYTFIEQLRDRERSLGKAPTAAIALTAYASSKDRTRALEAGFHSHIPKPVDRNELVALVESLKNQGRI